MPELPEVEEVRRTLEPHLLDRKIISVEIRRPDFVTPPEADWRGLVGDYVSQAYRHGKKIFLIFHRGTTLLLHLGMTGRVQAVETSSLILPHTHVILTLDNGRQIRFIDPRRFGGLWFYPTEQAARRKELAALGPDALQLTPEHLIHWRHTQGRLKARLLGQHDVAGLGNIYVDEALFRAGLHPLQRVCRIEPEKMIQLVACIHDVLNESLRSGGTTLRDYRNVADQEGAFARKLRAYGRGGLPCVCCGHEMATAVIAGRTTVWCRQCQRHCR